MIAVLRQEFLYTEKRARDMLFTEIEALLAGAAAPVMISKLTRDAATRAQEQGRAAGYEVANWTTAAKATINGMLGAGVILAADGSAIPLDIAAPAAEAAALAPGYRDRTEAYLLEVLIRKMADISARDHTALAHALFRQFDRSVPMDELEDRVAKLLATLSDRMVLVEGGAYRPAD